MSKLFQKPLRLEVKEDKEHQPIAFFHKGRMEKVEQMLKQWRITQGWWKKAIQRDYFQIRTKTGIVCELYRDLTTGTWYLQRIYD